MASGPGPVGYEEPGPSLCHPGGLLLPKPAGGPRQCPLAQESAKAVWGRPTHSLNKKLTSGKTALSHHLSAINTAEK